MLQCSQVQYFAVYGRQPHPNARVASADRLDARSRDSAISVLLIIIVIVIINASQFAFALYLTKVFTGSR